MKQILSNENLFLIIIAAAIGWQMANSHELARKAGQKKYQAIFFSLIFSLGIFFCVGNQQVYESRIGAGVEGLINILLVFLVQHPLRLKIKNLALEERSLRLYKKEQEEDGKQVRNGKRSLEITTEINNIRREIGILPTFVKLFIALLIPAVILFMSELYIGK